MKNSTFKSGFVAVVGFPNAGKSTLINKLVGEKISIVTHKPQTTRDNILGILNTENSQIIFVDTPGIIKGRNLLDRYMKKNSESAREDADIFLVVVDAKRGIGEKEMSLLNELDKRNKKSEKQVPIIVVMNKIDIVDEADMYTKLAVLNDMKFVSSVVSVSALKNKNVKLLLDVIGKYLPENELGEQTFYPTDIITDKSYRFMVGEIIREKLFTLVTDEIPFGTAVEITRFDRDSNLANIEATIYCEKDSHKGIIIGKGGSLLKKVGTAARYEIEKLLETKAYLKLFVKVKDEWRDDRQVLKDLGYL